MAASFTNARAGYVEDSPESQGIANKLLAELKQCGKRKELQRGKLLHSIAIELGCHKNIYVANTLISMYSKCGSMPDAQDVFNKVTRRSVVSWTALILGYVENGQSSVALDVFSTMECAPNRVTFLAVLKACTGLATGDKLEKGMSIHRQARENGLDREVTVANTLVDMYSKCGDMLRARQVFDGAMNRDVVSWNALILGYVENGDSSVALDLFDRIDCVPDSVTFVAALKACAALGSRQKALAVHKHARELGFERDILVASTLVDMYSKCGDMQRARRVFDAMLQRNVVSWTALILGYVENGESSVALEMFNSMDCAPDRVTLVAALKACACLGALESGQRIHERVRELGLERDETMTNCLIDFYGKCGDMAAAEEVFNKLSYRSLVSWTSLMGGYSSVGNTCKVFTVVKKMQECGVQMDGVAIMSILTACSRAGMVEEGQKHFESMSKYGVRPTVEHYSCMVDMLGRANRLQEALSLVWNMPFEANSVIWMTLLGACKKWSNVGVGEVAFGALMGLNKERGSVAAAAYVLMRNIYEKAGMQQEADRIESQRKAQVAWKKPGQTYWCDAEGRTRSFGVGYKMEQEVEEKVKAFHVDDV